MTDQMTPATRAANELLRKLNREVFQDSIDIAKLGIGVGLVEDFADYILAYKASCASQNEGVEGKLGTCESFHWGCTKLGEIPHPKSAGCKDWRPLPTPPPGEGDEGK